MIKAHRKERGQVLVLIVLAIVGMMGFAALAVDVGRVYAERRRAQNAADAASMAWAFESVWHDNDDQATAMNSLNQNEYQNIPGRYAITLNHPPASGPYTGDDAYYQVFISAKVDQVFGQFVRPGPYDLTVESVAHGAESESASGKGALVACGVNTCPLSGIDVNGGANLYVEDGDVKSNGEGCNSATLNGTAGTIQVVNGETILSTTLQLNGWPTVDSVVRENQGRFECPTMEPPACPANIIRSLPGNKILVPGTYDFAVNINRRGPWTMTGGIYCFTKGLTINGGGGQRDDVDNLTGTDVLIVMTGGDLAISGNILVNLTRADSQIDSNGNNYGGFLIIVPDTNPGGIDIGGSSGSSYTGTIFAPGERIPHSKAKCKFGGANETMGLNSSVICNTVSIAGNSVINIHYDENTNGHFRPKVDLSQ